MKLSEMRLPQPAPARKLQGNEQRLVVHQDAGEVADRDDQEGRQ